MDASSRLSETASDEAHTAMVVSPGLFDKGHIGIVKVQGVNEGSGSSCKT